MTGPTTPTHIEVAFRCGRQRHGLPAVQQRLLAPVDASIAAVRQRRDEDVQHARAAGEQVVALLAASTPVLDRFREVHTALDELASTRPVGDPLGALVLASLATATVTVAWLSVATAIQARWQTPTRELPFVAAAAIPLVVIVVAAGAAWTERARFIDFAGRAATRRWTLAGAAAVTWLVGALGSEGIVRPAVKVLTGVVALAIGIVGWVGATVAIRVQSDTAAEACGRMVRTLDAEVTHISAELRRLTAAALKISDTTAAIEELRRRRDVMDREIVDHYTMGETLSLGQGARRDYGRVFDDLE